MRCPACDAEIPDEMSRCGVCDKQLTRRSRRRNSVEESDSPSDGERYNVVAMRAYRLCVLGLVPGLGLVLGPFAVALGALAKLRGSKASGFTASAAAMVAMLLGSLITITQWVGVTLIVLSLHAQP